MLYVYIQLGSKNYCEVEEDKLLDEESDDDGNVFKEDLQGSEREQLQSDENDKIAADRRSEEEDRSSNSRPERKQRKLVKEKVSSQNTHTIFVCD